MAQETKQDPTPLRTRLQVCAAEYNSRVDEWRVLRDAWTGEGGFQAPLDMPPIGQNGFPIEQVAAPVYIDQFSRESARHWCARARTAYYPNHFKTILEIVCGFLGRKPLEWTGLPTWLEEWSKDVDGSGTGLRAFIDDAVQHVIAVGWWPILVDRPTLPDGATKADAKAAGVRTFCSLVDPDVITAWGKNVSGRMTWFRSWDEFERWESPDGAPEQIQRWTEWLPAEVRGYIYRVYEGQGADEVTEVDSGVRDDLTSPPLVLASWGGSRIPFAIRRSPMFSIAMLARALFNRLNEEVDFMRGANFPHLAWPVMQGRKIGRLRAGTEIATPFPGESSHAPLMLSPDAAISGAFAGVIQRMTGDIYEQARADFVRSQNQLAETGVAKTIRFQGLNSNLVIADLTRVDILRGILRLVCESEGRDPAVELRGFACEASVDFDLAELDRELQQAGTGLTLGLGPTADAALRKQTRDRLITLKADEKQRSDEEINRLRDTERATLMGTGVPPAGQGDLTRPQVPEELIATPAGNATDDMGRPPMPPTEG